MVNDFDKVMEFHKKELKYIFDKIGEILHERDFITSIDALAFMIASLAFHNIEDRAKRNSFLDFLAKNIKQFSDDLDKNHLKRVEGEYNEH